MNEKREARRLEAFLLTLLAIALLLMAWFSLQDALRPGRESLGTAMQQMETTVYLENVMTRTADAKGRP